MYDQWTVKIAANLLQAGVVFGVPMQPYEAHINWYMHFYGDYCLGGNEYIKVSQFRIRHLPTLPSECLRHKTYYPQIFKEIGDRNSLEQSGRYRDESGEQDFSFL